MSNTIYSDEQKELLIGSLQSTIEDCKKKISIAQTMIKDIMGDSIESSRPVFSKFTVAKKARDNGMDWFSKIEKVLLKGDRAMTSREILDKIYDEYPEIVKDSTHMGSLSSSLRSKTESKDIIREKTDGEFARFRLPDPFDNL